MNSFFLVFEEKLILPLYLILNGNEILSLSVICFACYEEQSSPLPLCPIHLRFPVFGSVLVQALMLLINLLSYLLKVGILLLEVFLPVLNLLQCQLSVDPQFIMQLGIES